MKNRNKIMIVSGLMALVLVVLLVWFLFMQIKQNSEKFFTVKKDIISLDIQNKEIENFKAKYQEYKLNLDNFGQLFIDPKNPVELIKFIESTVGQSGIESSFSLLPAPDQQNPGVISFQLSLSEDFLKIMDFSEKLEHGPYLVQIKNLVIKSKEQLPGSKEKILGHVDASFTINVFTSGV